MLAGLALPLRSALHAEIFIRRRQRVELSVEIVFAFVSLVGHVRTRNASQRVRPNSSRAPFLSYLHLLASFVFFFFRNERLLASVLKASGRQ